MESPALQPLSTSHCPFSWTVGSRVTLKCSPTLCQFSDMGRKLRGLLNGDMATFFCMRGENDTDSLVCCVGCGLSTHTEPERMP